MFIEILGCKYDINIDHVITIVGHTINSDLWDPLAENYYTEPNINEYTILQSRRWVDHYIAMDDLLGPYLCLGKQFLEDRTQRITGIVNSLIEVDSLDATKIAIEALNIAIFLEKVDDSLQWIKILKDGHHLPVFRIFLINKNEYITHLKDDIFIFANFKTQAEILENLQKLPSQFWMIEFSVPDLYTANKTKLGEILIQKDKKTLDTLRYNLLAVRLPGHYISFLKHNIEFYYIKDISKHYPLFKRQTEIPFCPEW